MTKVDLHYDLVRPLTDADADVIARVHSVYGIYRVLLSQPAMDAVTVEFDASRLTERDVEAALLSNGIPIARK